MQGQMRLVGIILAVVGAGLLIWGFQMSDSLGNQVTESLTGSSSDAVMYRYIGGAACLAVGAFLFLQENLAMTGRPGAHR